MFATVEAEESAGRFSKHKSFVFSSPPDSTANMPIEIAANQDIEIETCIFST